jgi:hypothetical protein
MVVGVRELKEITIFPLSYGDMKKFTDKISEVIKDFAEKQEEGEENTLNTIRSILTLIEENLVDISNMVCEEPLDVDKMTNEQVVEFCEKVYDLNFEGASKKFQSLKAKVVSLWT